MVMATQHSTHRYINTPRENRRRRVMLVDDHPIVRQGLRRLIEAEPDLEVCGEADQVPLGWGIEHRALRVPPKAGTLV